MSFIKKIFGNRKELNTPKIETVEAFWVWFSSEEQNFYKIIEEGDNEKLSEFFFKILEAKLNELKEGIKFLTGMLDDGTADLILTADGCLQNLYLVGELIEKAPKLDNWLFQAHKQPHSDDNFGLSMDDVNFDTTNISFYAIDDEVYPDEINLIFVHDDLTDDNEYTIKNGTYIFLENYIGEIRLATIIDSISFSKKNLASQKLIPLTKLKNFLIWREKEFVEKYEGKRYSTQNDNYSVLEAELKDGRPLVASVNQDLLEWDAKASHPWILEVCFEFNGDDKGMPLVHEFDLMNLIGDEIKSQLKDEDGYLLVCRETADSRSYVNFACKDYMKPPKVIDVAIAKYSHQIKITQTCYKDKYWRSFERYLNV